MGAATASRYAAQYPAIAPQLCGQALPWLQQLRAAALTQFSAQGFPSLRQEEWRYTNVSAIEKKLFAPAASITAGAVDREWLQSYQLADAWSLVLVDGHFSAELSVLDGLPEGVFVQGLADALATQPKILASTLNSAATNAGHGFIAFNTAWFSDGLFVHIPAQQVLAKPIQVLHIATQAGVLASTRSVIVVDAQAEAEIVENLCRIGYRQGWLCMPQACLEQARQTPI